MALRLSGYRRFIYAVFVVYFSVMIVFVMPVKRVEANPLAILASQVSRLGLQRAAQGVGISIASRAGVRVSTTPAAQTAYKRWFQTSSHAASKMLQNTYKAGAGTVDGWIKVLMGGAAASSLVSQTKVIYNDIKNMVTKSGGVTVGKPGTYTGNYEDFHPIDSFTYVTEEIEPFNINFEEWVIDIEPGLNVNTGSEFVFCSGGESISQGQPFVYVPINKHVAFSTEKGTLYVHCYPTRVFWNISYWATRYKYELIMENKTTGKVDKWVSEEVGTYFLDSEKRKVSVAPIYGLILYVKTYYGNSWLTLAPVIGPDQNNWGQHLMMSQSKYKDAIGYQILVWEGTQPDDFIYDFISMDNFTIDTVDDGSTENPLIIQVPDFDYWQAQNPTYTREEVDALIADLILQNRELVTAAENEIIGEIEALEKYFDQDVDYGEDPGEDPGPGVNYSSWLDQIVDYLRSIWESVNPASESFLLYKAFVPSEGYLTDAFTSIRTAWDTKMGGSIFSTEFGWYEEEPEFMVTIGGDILPETSFSVVNVDIITTGRDKIRFWLGGIMVFLTFMFLVKRIPQLLKG